MLCISANFFNEFTNPLFPRPLPSPAYILLAFLCLTFCFTRPWQHLYLVQWFDKAHPRFKIWWNEFVQSYIPAKEKTFAQPMYVCRLVRNSMWQSWWLTRCAQADYNVNKYSCMPADEFQSQVFWKVGVSVSVHARALATYRLAAGFNHRQVVLLNNIHNLA